MSTGILCALGQSAGLKQSPSRYEANRPWIIDMQSARTHRKDIMKASTNWILIAECTFKESVYQSIT